MKIVEQPNSDWIQPTRLELAIYRALTGMASLPLTVEQWNDGIKLGKVHWSEAQDHTPRLSLFCMTLLDELEIDHATYDDPSVEIVRADQAEGADDTK